VSHEVLCALIAFCAWLNGFAVRGIINRIQRRRG
jgi:hypothetical protein